MPSRGTVVPLTPEQTVRRWLYLAGELPITALDDYVRKDGAATMCPTIYYLLREHNGGKDPTAPNPADYWSSDAELARCRRETAAALKGGPRPTPPFVNRTADCVAAVAWGQGWDRYQPRRGSHIYDGWINTDSMREDAAGPAKCFRRIDRPEPGALVVFGSDPLRKAHGISIGHVAGVVGYAFPEWDPRVRECWDAIRVVDISARGAGTRANLARRGGLWFGKDSWFLVPTMQP